MNAETFINFINDPAQLYKISYTELKSLVSQYPYCQNLRYLLLKKCMIEDYQDFEDNLQLAATFSNNRQLLFKQIRKHESTLSEADSLVFKEAEPAPVLKLNIDEEPDQSDKEPGINNNESFEIDHLNEEIKEPDPEIPAEKEEDKAVKKEKDISYNEPAYFDGNDLDAEIEDITEEMEFEYDFENIQANVNEATEDYKKVISIEELIELDTLNLHKKSVDSKNEVASKTEPQTMKQDDTPPEIDSKKKGTPNLKKKPPPTPKSSFGSWVKQFQESESSEKYEKRKGGKKEKKKHKKKNDVSKKLKNKKIEKKGKKSSALAEQSLKENKEIATETLASLLASQGSFEKAIEMYERLSLIFPKKSSYFADQIKKLKNN